jgi:hypothetical protein
MKQEPIYKDFIRFVEDGSLCACQINHNDGTWGLYCVYEYKAIQEYSPKPVVYWRVKKLKHDTPTN